MISEKVQRGRPPAYSRIALGLVVCGLALGGLWALSLIGFGVDLLVRHLVP